MSRPQKILSPVQLDFPEVLVTIANANKPSSETVDARPFIKWVGGKRSILPLLLERMPIEYGSYHEPFVGGGALYFAIQPKKAFLSDINFPLVITYKIIRDEVKQLINQLKIHEKKHSENYFARARVKFAKEIDAVKIAALFIYLNKACYNGLYRVNKAGRFNVPIGSYEEPTLFEEEVLLNDSRVLKNTLIEQRHFSQIEIIREDFYYLDPPYHQTYDGYNHHGFGDTEHADLAKVCRKIAAAGGYFMLSNSDTPFVRDLYKGFNIEQVAALRTVSCKSNQRGRENELVIRNYGEK